MRKSEGEVICRSLDLGDYVTLSAERYGPHENAMYVVHLRCGGDESSIEECSSRMADRTECQNGSYALVVAAIVCSG